MKYLCRLIIVFFFTTSISSIGQISKVISINTKNLPSNIKWKQIISDNNLTFVLGFRDSDLMLYNLNTEKLLKISETGQEKFAFLLNDFIHIGTLGDCNSKIISENKIMIFNKEGKQTKNTNITCKGTIISYLAEPKHSKIFLLTIDLEEYLSGRTDGMLKGALFEILNLNPVIKFEYKQSPPPNRIALPVVAKGNGKVFLAFEDKYNIDVYSERGNKLYSFTFPDFKPIPYTLNEINHLSRLHQMVVEIGNSYPPIIRKMEINNQHGLLFITRYTRPRELSLFIDLFELKGKFVKTYEFIIQENENLIDSCLLSEKEYALLLLSNDAEYLIKTFRLE